ncbi:MAG: 50S ribosomal protein L22 [Verrucomicrobiae bacterium]|nr:50S ribosomal protein L22 [Verrucomicrobiae bacterium]
MEVQAVTKNVRIAPRKAREVMRQISGLPVEEAQALLQYIPRKAARLIFKTLKSAVANAEDQARVGNLNLNTAKLRVSRAEIGAGIAIKRMRTRARGAASVIKKRTSHISIVVSDDANSSREPQSKSKSTSKSKSAAKAKAKAKA